jgi:hypothetical protein
VLREAGVIKQRDDGVWFNRLPRKEFEECIPSLLTLVLREEAAPRG